MPTDPAASTTTESTTTTTTASTGSSPVLLDLALSRGGVDRLGEVRAREGELARWWGDDAVRVVRVAAGRTPVRSTPQGPRLELVAPSAVHATGVTAILGEDPEGVRYVVAEVEDPSSDPGAQEWSDLRALGTLLPDTEAGLLTQAVALLHWHERHPRCPRCGAPTEVVSGGWVRRCTADGSEHFPRTDAAVIMTVVDDAGRLLLGHNEAWPANRYSALAGFVEPGESLEAAVRREVAEEVGVRIGTEPGDVAYLGSQPWPFPASLMLGFTARAVDTAVRTDDVEISEARWFTREELAQAVRARDVLLPPAVSIARRLVEHWYGGPIADDTPWP